MQQSSRLVSKTLGALSLLAAIAPRGHAPRGLAAAWEFATGRPMSRASVTDGNGRPQLSVTLKFGGGVARY